MNDCLIFFNLKCVGIIKFKKVNSSKVVANVAKLHRAVLRNWHHILMMIGNFAGTNIDTDSMWLQHSFIFTLTFLIFNEIKSLFIRKETFLAVYSENSYLDRNN